MKSLLKCLRPSAAGSVPSATGDKRSAEQGPTAGGLPGCAGGGEQPLEFVPGRGIAYAREGVREEDLQVAEDVQLREALAQSLREAEAATLQGAQGGQAAPSRGPRRTETPTAESEEWRQAIAESLEQAAPSRQAALGAGPPAPAAGLSQEGAPWTCAFCETRNSGADSASGCRNCGEPSPAEAARLLQRGAGAAVGQGADCRGAPLCDQTVAAERKAMEALNELVSNCVQANAQFVDPEFAPSGKVLYSNGRCRRREADQLLIVQHYERNHGRDVQWRRPGEIWQRPDDLMMEFDSREEMILTMRDMSKLVPWKVFQSDPQPTDISQGALGNCWFCGSLAAVAEKPDLVKRLFVDENSRRGDLSPQGVYLLRLCDGGEWRFITTDDNFPCNSSNMLAYSGARRNQLWVPLVEKAFAKIRGCYEETEGGTPSEGLRLLTGWPSIGLQLQADPQRQAEEGGGADSEQARYQLAMRVQASIPFVDEELLWIRLVSACSANLILCGSCGHVEGISKEQYRGAGLSPSHCYSIVHVATAKGGSVRLIKLRNPWGTGLKWKGDFSDDDAKNWTPEVKAEVGATDLGTDGGIFWMTLQDLLRYFNSITICPYQPGWHEFRHTAEFPPTLDGPQPGVLLGRHARGQHTEALLSLMQPEERASRSMMTVDLGVVLMRVPKADAPKPGDGPFGASASVRSRLKFVDSVRRKVSDTVLQDAFLEEGEDSAGLLAVPLSFNQRVPAGSDGDLPFSGGSGSKRFTFSCFSARELPSRALDLAPELVRDALVEHVKRRGTLGTESRGVRLYKHAEAGLTVYLENASASFVEITAELTEIFNLTVSRGIEADAMGNLSMKSRDVVPPMHGMVVFVAAAMPAGFTYRFSSRFQPLAGGTDGPQHRPPLAEPTDNLHCPHYLEGQQPVRHGYAAPLGLHPEGAQRHRGQPGDPACEQQ